MSRLILFFALGFLPLILPAISYPQEIVAVVNGEKISKEELVNWLLETRGKEVLREIISIKLFYQEAKRQKITVSKEEVNQRLEEIKKLQGEDSFNSWQKSSGISLKILKGNIERELLINKMAQQKITVTEEEIKKYYQDNPNKFQQPEMVRIRRIIVEDKKEAQDIYKKLTKGEDFAVLAKECSQDIATKSRGGDLGYISPDTLLPQEEERVMILQKGEFSEPIESLFGHIILKLEDRQKAKKFTFQESKERIRELIYATKKNQFANQLMSQLWEKAEIEEYLRETLNSKP